MESKVAQWIARLVHAGQFSRFGEPIIDHVERVAESVPADLRAVAYLHDVLERSEATPYDLRCYGLTDAEIAVLELLTRDQGESYEDYVERIASAPGADGAIARRIKLADLNDHLRHRVAGVSAPDYAWARDRIRASQRTHRERPVPAGKVG